MNLNITFLLLLSILITSCLDSDKEYTEKKNFKYYQNEILSEKFIGLYGKWRLEKIETGWGYLDLDFDYLEIIPYGSFSIIRNDSNIIDGRIKVILQDSTRLKIDFIPEKESTNGLIEDSEKWIEFDNKRVMWMVSPCCDRANYLMKKR